MLRGLDAKHNTLGCARHLAFPMLSQEEVEFIAGKRLSKSRPASLKAACELLAIRLPQEAQTLRNAIVKERTE